MNDGTKVTVAHYAPPDSRELTRIRELGPKFPGSRGVRKVLLNLSALNGFRWLENRKLIRSADCAFCGRKSTEKKVFVHPITLQREFYNICHRQRCITQLREWEGVANSRRRRAQFDWERQNPEAAAAELIGFIPPQYPSVSRATLRAFLDSDMDVATIEDSNGFTAVALNGSIKTLGFGDQVYAEIRSGQVVLKKIRKEIE